MKVLVTGASGRLGPFVVTELEAAGHELVLLCRSRPGAADRWPWVQGDITCFDDCLRATEGGIEAVQHLAAQPGPVDHPSMRARAEEQGIPFDQTMRSNIMGTYYLLQACVQRGIRTFVMTGSNCALGHGFRISGTEVNGEEMRREGDHEPHVVGEHARLRESHVFEDLMQLVDWVGEGTPSIASAEHARHVIDIFESAYRADDTGQTQELTTTFEPLTPAEA